MKILVTLPDDEVRARLFPKALQERLRALGEVTWNPKGRQFSATELSEALTECEGCVTSWHVPRIDRQVLQHARRLKQIAHVGGTVAPVVSDEVYAQGVAVCSANRVLARYVAEGILGYALASLRNVSRLDRLMHGGTPWPRIPEVAESLYGRRIGFVGLGTVGRWLLDLLRPFSAQVSVYDPYITSEDLSAWPFARLQLLDEVLRSSSFVSVHAALTSETRHLLNRTRLALLPDGALLVNAARGAIIDQAALIDELAGGRLRAVLDVFEEEPLPITSPLRQLENVILMPHLAGAASHGALAEAMVEEMERFVRGEPLQHVVLAEHFRRMTRPLPNGR